MSSSTMKVVTLYMIIFHISTIGQFTLNPQKLFDILNQSSHKLERPPLRLKLIAKIKKNTKKCDDPIDKSDSLGEMIKSLIRENDDHNEDQESESEQSNSDDDHNIPSFFESLFPQNEKENENDKSDTNDEISSPRIRIIKINHQNEENDNNEQPFEQPLQQIAKILHIFPNKEKNDNIFENIFPNLSNSFDEKVQNNDQFRPKVKIIRIDPENGGFEEISNNNLSNSPFSSLLDFFHSSSKQPISDIFSQKHPSDQSPHVIRISGAIIRSPKPFVKYDFDENPDLFHSILLKNIHSASNPSLLSIHTNNDDIDHTIINQSHSIDNCDGSQSHLSSIHHIAVKNDIDKFISPSFPILHQIIRRKNLPKTCARPKKSIISHHLIKKNKNGVHVQSTHIIKSHPLQKNPVKIQHSTIIHKIVKPSTNKINDLSNYKIKKVRITIPMKKRIHVPVVHKVLTPTVFHPIVYGQNYYQNPQNQIYGQMFNQNPMFNPFIDQNPQFQQSQTIYQGGYQNQNVPIVNNFTPNYYPYASSFPAVQNEVYNTQQNPPQFEMFQPIRHVPVFMNQPTQYAPQLISRTVSYPVRTAPFVDHQAFEEHNMDETKITTTSDLGDFGKKLNEILKSLPKQSSTVKATV